jgi:hypothetical protein
MASGDNSGPDFALALHMTAMHIDTIQSTRETHMSMNRLYLLLGEHLGKHVPEDQVFPAMVEYCKRHGLDTPWDNNLKGTTPEQAIGKQIKAVFRLSSETPGETETVTGTVVVVHPYRGILALFPSGHILVNQIDLWEFA